MALYIHDVLVVDACLSYAKLSSFAAHDRRKSWTISSMFMQPSTRAWIANPEAGFSGDSPIDNGEPDRQATPPNAYDYADLAQMIWRKGNPKPQFEDDDTICN